MNRRTESRLNMAKRALEFSQAHSSESPGYANAVKQLADQLTRATQLAEEQRRGTAEVRAATIQKDRIRRSLRRSDLVHLAGVAERAAVEDPELSQKFDLPRIPARGLAFRAAARTMIELAEQRKDLLSKYGLVDEVLLHARKSIDELDGLVERGAEGRRIHIGASASLEVVANETVRLVRILDGFNRVRFGNDPNLIAGWIAAANIIGPARSAGQAEGRRGGDATPPESPAEPGQIKPAA